MSDISSSEAMASIVGAAKMDWRQRKATGRAALHVIEGSAPDPETEPSTTGLLPELLIDNANLPFTAKVLALLISQHESFLFNGHAPIRVAVEANCLPQAVEVTLEAVRIFAHDICVPRKHVRRKDGEEEVIDITLPSDVAGLYLFGLKGSWNLKLFHGIATSPILSDDGSVRVVDGYDHASGLWCHNIPKLDVLANPTRDDALAALQQIRFLFRTFPFADAVMRHDEEIGVDVVDLNKKMGLDESSTLAGLMTSVCRASLELAPGDLAVAAALSGSGSGKGLLQRAKAIIASGAAPEAFTAGHDMGEFEKRLTASLIEARPATLLDNFNGKNLKSDTLASALTETPCKVRVFGHTKNVPLHTRTFIAITGNNVQIAEDMARRLIVTRLDARMENPDSRPFAPGFLERVFAERPKILAAVLTIWRWGRQNKLPRGKPIGSFEKWAEWCRDPLLALGARDPVDRIAEIKAADPERLKTVAIFDAWWQAHADALLKAVDLDPTVIMQIDDKAAFREGSLQCNRQFVAGQVAGLIDTHIGGYALKKIQIGPRSKRTSHYKLTQTQDEGNAA